MRIPPMAGNRAAAKTPMMAMAVSNSIRVKPGRRRELMESGVDLGDAILRPTLPP